MVNIYEVSRETRYTFLALEIEESEDFKKSDGWKYHLLYSLQNRLQASEVMATLFKIEKGSYGFFTP